MYTTMSILKIGKLYPKEFIWLPKVTQLVMGLDLLTLSPGFFPSMTVHFVYCHSLRMTHQFVN